MKEPPVFRVSAEKHGTGFSAVSYNHLSGKRKVYYGMVMRYVNSNKDII